MYMPNDRSHLIFQPRRDLVGRFWRHYFKTEMPDNQPWEAPRLRLHYHLCYNPHNSRLDAEILWDIILPPQFARVWARTFFRRWKSPDLSQAALEPSVETVWILSDHTALAYWMNRWGPIIVRSESVTIGDILQAIYTFLRVPLTPEDLRDISSVPGNRKSLRFARAQRAKDSHELESVVIAHGYKRVDVLGGHRKFHGMRVVVLPDRTWRLYVGFCPGPVPRMV